jgi:putative DNA methylase
MSQEPAEPEGRTELPIERGFPIERINEIAAKEGRAKMHYRPIYTMHKWWARRLGCVFRSISLYTLLDDPEKVSVFEPGHEGGTLADYSDGDTNIDVASLLERVDLSDPESLWELYPKDVRVEDKKILDPFMGGGTSLVEASRFGAEVVGNDLNPVAWFVTKKELEAGQTDVEELEAAFEQVKEDVANEITQYYRTPCPNGDHEADVMYNFWVKELDCVSCGHTVPLYNDYRVAKGRYDNDDKYNVLCPDCGAVTLVDDWQSDSTCNDCGHGFVPKEGNVSRGGNYNCPDCGQQYGITDAIQEQGGYDLRLYALEYYCEHCDDAGEAKSAHKGYKQAEEFDKELYREAEREWENNEELHEYVPQENIPPGHMTSERNPVFDHDYSEWTDMFNQRQLLALSTLLKRIEKIEEENLREHFLLAFSNTLCTNNAYTGYDYSYNKIQHLFKTNSFDPPSQPTEGNVWGAEFGRGTFESMFDLIKRGVQYANAPTERYVVDGETTETEEFGQPIGRKSELRCGDARQIDAENEFDAVITDPPYYDNIMYSEVADFFYVWQKILLEDEYPGFDQEKTPRAESIVTNPFLDKTAEDFESELEQSFSVIKRALKDDGALTFTYHHSDSESWGELLESLCNVGFEVTATYPISADSNKFITGEAVEFDIIIVARPSDERTPISWNALRRNIVRTAKETHEKLTENRNLSKGDIGVVEMGRAFHEYSKHHGEVQRGGETMTAKEVVDEIYGIIQQGSDIGEIDAFLDLLEMDDPSYNDLNIQTRGTNADPDTMKDDGLYHMESGELILGTWDDEKRRAIIEKHIEEGEEALSPLDKAQFLRYRYEHGKSIQEYLEEWEITDDLRELCEGLADATGDDVYRRILGGDRGISEF